MNETKRIKKLMTRKDIPCQKCLTMVLCVAKIKPEYEDYMLRKRLLMPPYFDTIENEVYMTWCIGNITPNCSVIRNFLFETQTIAERIYNTNGVIRHFMSIIDEGTINECGKPM